MVSGSGVVKPTIVVDARHHMLGRLASILAKELLNGQSVVRSHRFIAIHCYVRGMLQQLLQFTVHSPYEADILSDSKLRVFLHLF